jgi:hypothetical protein
MVVTVSGTASNGVNFTVGAQSACKASAGNATALLTGDYAFSGQGQNQAHFYALAGRFHADGVNTITNGLIEQNEIGLGGDYIAPVTFTGCFDLNTPQGSSGVALGTLSINAAAAVLGGQHAMTLAIAIQSNGDGRLITYDSNQVQVSGSVQKQCPNAANGSCPAFANANVSGDYAFGFAGMLFGGGGENFAAVGRLTTDGAGGASSAMIDMSSYAGIDASNDTFTASYALDPSNGATGGRVVITANVTYNRATAGNNGLTVAFEFGCYLANINSGGTAAGLYCITTNGTSQGPPEIPLLHGRFLRQSTPSGGWTNANVIPPSGASVGSSIGIDGSGTPRTSIFQVNSWNPNANPGTVVFNQDLNKGGSSSFTANAALDYSVAANGRIQISNPATSPATLLSVGYIIGPGEGFTVDVSNNAALGFLQPQEAMPAGGFTAANFDNAFAFGTAGILQSGVTHFDGVATSNGSGGMFSGQGYSNGSVGPAAGNVAATYSIASPADAAIGRVTSSLTEPFVDSAVLYIIDANTAVTMSTVSINPVIIHLTH